MVKYLFVFDIIHSRQGGKYVGSRKLKLNFKLLRGKEIGTIINGKKRLIGILEQVRFVQQEKRYQFTFENGYVLIIRQDAVYYHTILHYESDCIYMELSDEIILSGIVAYSLYETYGLPLEDTVDEVSCYGLRVDEKGFYILQELQRQKNKGTFKNRNAFETGDQ